MTNSRYVRTADQIRLQIKEARFGDSGVLPTEADLGHQFSVSRTTIRRALHLLRDEGLVVSRQGSGWRTTPHHPTVRVGVRHQRPEGGPSEARLDLVDHGPRVPPSQIASVLDSDPAEALLVIERATVISDQMVHRSETWFSPSASTSLDEVRVLTEPPALLLRSLGHTFGPFEQFIEATLSNERDEELLGTPPAQPMLQVTRIAVNQLGAPLFVSLHRHPGASTRIDVDLPTTNQDGNSMITIEMDG